MRINLRPSVQLPNAISNQKNYHQIRPFDKGRQAGQAVAMEPILVAVKGPSESPLIHTIAFFSLSPPRPTPPPPRAGPPPAFRSRAVRRSSWLLHEFFELGMH